MDIKLMLINNYMRLMRIFKGRKKRILFESFSGKSYSDNTKAISEKLHEISPGTEIVWAFLDVDEKRNVVPEYVKCINMRNHFVYFGMRAQSDVLVSNFSVLPTVKFKKQLYIQTWHGDRAFKKVLYDVADYDMRRPLAESIKGYCDYAIAGSRYGVMQYRSAFKYGGEVIAKGTPRNDCLVNPSDEKRMEIKNNLNIQNDTRILLYAPTMRDAVASGELQKIQSINLDKTLKLLEDKYSSKWICFVRAHSAMKGLSGVEVRDNIIDVSAYEDMADLLLIADMLITDYSSSAGDFALLGKPLVLFQSDREDYETNNRKFYFEMEDSPYYIAENQEELEKIILEFDEDSVKKNCEDILGFYGTRETGKASEIVAQLVVDHINKL